MTPILRTKRRRLTDRQQSHSSELVLRQGKLSSLNLLLSHQRPMLLAKKRNDEVVEETEYKVTTERQHDES